ncbi:MAG: tetratricopeptide repeat protein, partial [Pyrinomonadaceae bacterium]
MEGRNGRSAILFVLLVAIIAGAIVRSDISTSLDGFTFDEAYHIGAGVSYVKTGDFRLNPEHPPLVKLCVGTYLSLFDYQITPFRKLADKTDERAFVENEVFNNNDHLIIQTRARTAMFALNSLLMLGFGLAVWRVLGKVFAVGTTAFLAIDPTVAAHMPVVMTDLPVALTSATAMILAVGAFKSWSALDLFLAALALGVALASKHSAVIAFIVVMLVGAGMLAVFHFRNGKSGIFRHVASIAAVGLGAVVLLWAFYGFRYYESPLTVDDQFNRSLPEKISDVKSPVYRAGLNAMSNWYLTPRSYTWGLADTVRAGVEGRIGTPLVFGNSYYGSAPWFYFPGIVAVKVPLGLLVLSVVGLALIIGGIAPKEIRPPLAGLLLLFAIFVFFLIRGSSYGGIRHLMVVYPLLALMAAAVVEYAVRRRSYLAGGFAALCLVFAMISAIPVMRPWEYFNESIGGTANGHKYFNDEGVDLYQRSEEAVRYYHDVLKPAGLRPYLFYLMPEINDPEKTVDWISGSKEKDAGKWDGPMATGIFIIGANEIAPTFWWDKASFREAQPIARFGNLFVFEGTFDIRPLLAQGLQYRATFLVYGPEPDIDKAIGLLVESADLDPRAFFVSLERGNLYLKTGKRDEALAAYRTAY